MTNTKYRFTVQFLQLEIVIVTWHSAFATTVTIFLDFMIVTYGNVQIEVHETSTKENVIIILPGLHGDCSHLTSFLQEFNTSQVITVKYLSSKRNKNTIEEYADSLFCALSIINAREGFIIAESFGSQVAWRFLELLKKNTAPFTFQVKALILAGGFLSHPFPRLVRLFSYLYGKARVSWLNLAFRAYFGFVSKATGAKKLPNTFFEERSSLQDQKALISRMELMQNDFRKIAENIRCNVYLLVGFWDVIAVPWPLNYFYLNKYCPKFEAKWDYCFWGDHAVLYSEPKKSASIIKNWIKREESL